MFESQARNCTFWLDLRAHERLHIQTQAPAEMHGESGHTVGHVSKLRIPPRGQDAADLCALETDLLNSLVQCITVCTKSIRY